MTLHDLIGHRVSYTGADGQRHYAGKGLRVESGYPDGSVRLVCSGRPGYDGRDEVCRLSVADRPARMPRNRRPYGINQTAATFDHKPATWAEIDEALR